MLEEYLIQTCSIVTMARNRFGDYIRQSIVTEACRFREITTVRRMPNQEVNDADAMLWLASTTTAVKGSIVLFDGVYYQIERLTRARTLDDDTVQFVKCDLKITDIAIS